jgi:hypothetical protein
MNFKPLPYAHVAIRSWLVATFHMLARMFGVGVADVHKIARRELVDDELVQPPSDSAS